MTHIHIQMTLEKSQPKVEKCQMPIGSFYPKQKSGTKNVVLGGKFATINLVRFDVSQVSFVCAQPIKWKYFSPRSVFLEVHIEWKLFSNIHTRPVQKSYFEFLVAARV